MRPTSSLFPALCASWLLLVPLGMCQDSTTPRHNNPFKTDFVGLWLMGQSLCDGSESLPIVTSADTGFGNVSFARGVRTWRYGDHGAEPQKRPTGDFALTPLKAVADGGLGETVANGLADHLTSTLRLSKPPRFLVAHAGQGGRTIAELSKADESTDPRTPEAKKHGGGYYLTSLDDARRAVSAAAKARQKFAIGALVWMQGEGNGGPTGGIMPHRWGTELPRPEGQQWYRDRLIAYRQQWSADLSEITGQRGEIPLFTYQTLGPAGEAQLAAADADPHITLVGSHYAVPSAINSRTTRGRFGDAIHLSADGERWFGEQIGKVMRRVLVEGEDWQPLRPRTAWIEPDRTSIRIDFTVPRPPLVLDEKFLPLQQSTVSGGYSSLAGIRVRGADGSAPLISSIEVEGSHGIRISLTKPLPQGVAFTAGYGLPYAGELGQIQEIKSSSGETADTDAELVLSSAFPAGLQALLDEGAFVITNTEARPLYAQAIVRKVVNEGQQSRLHVRRADLRDGVAFKKGQTLVALRPFSYGNLRDSDAEAATFKFGDREYGRRAGQAYPLWNWCVLFNGFTIEDRKL